MVVLLHILIALASVIYTTVVFIFPSQKKLHISYILILLTIISGSYLIFTMPAHMVSSCITGLVYIAVMLTEIIAIRIRLAKRYIPLNKKESLK